MSTGDKQTEGTSPSGMSAGGKGMEERKKRARQASIGRVGTSSNLTFVLVSPRAAPISRVTTATRCAGRREGKRNSLSQFSNLRLTVSSLCSAYGQQAASHIKLRHVLLVERRL